MPGKLRWQRIDGPVDARVLEDDGTVLLESQLRDEDNKRSYLLCNPVETITCRRPGDVERCLVRLDEKLQQGFAAAGFITYEAGLVLAPAQEQRTLVDFPLLHLGIYDCIHFSDSPLLIAPAGAVREILDPQNSFLDVSEKEFCAAVGTIRDLISQGEVYQVNYTVRMRSRSSVSPGTIYRHLRKSHPVPYGGYLRFGGTSLITQSPELFLKKDGRTMETRPMKGTAGRGEGVLADSEAERNLRESEKDRAENLMIADLMRNDLGRIAVPGSVEVFDVFRTEPYNSLYQMTTGVRAEVTEGTTAGDVLRATFPPGSVTGAPKVRAMQIISRLEKTPRKAYTGAVGVFFPDGDIALNVAIRTVIAGDEGSIELGVGSGIVYDSSPEKEYEETLLKSAFLRLASDDLRLLETMLVEKDSGPVYLEKHISRMENSARALDFPYSGQKAKRALDLYLEGGLPEPAILRLLLNRRGDFIVDLSPLEPKHTPENFRVVISETRTDPSNKLLYHKTTSRELYESELERARNKGHNEVLFLNTEGYLTEGAFTNAFIYRRDGWVTPELACGLLPGIWRSIFLSETGAKEDKLAIDDLSSAERVVVGNSVRGSIEVYEVVDKSGQIIFRLDRNRMGCD